jgi:SPOR domain
MSIRSAIPVVLCASVVLAACNSAASDWRKAIAANSVAAYETFLREHGSDEHADNARGRILALQDDQAWSKARAAKTADSYDAYLKTEGGGVHAQEARYYLTALQRAEDWKGIQNGASAASLQAFLQKYPQGPEAQQARAQLKALNFRVQLAESRSKAGAERKRAELQAKFGKVLRDILVVPRAGAGTVFLVTSGPMSEATANSACATLQRAHQSCKLVEDAATPG